METRFCNQEAEQMILGSIILNHRFLEKVADIILPKHFYFIEHREIWMKLIETSQESEVNQVTLGDYFKNNELIKAAGGINYLSILLLKASAIISLRDLSKKLIELWQKRELEILLTKSLDSLVDKKFDFIYSNLENEIAGLTFQEPKKKTQHISEILDDIAAEEALGVSEKFVPTGFKGLDKILNGGLHSQQLMIIGARPSVGKTTIGQNIMINASKLGKKCLFISLEVDKRNVVLKFLADLSSVQTWKISKRILNQDEIKSLNRANGELRKMGIYTNDSSYLKIGQITRIIKSQIEKEPVDLVVVDYVQIIRGEDTKWKNEASLIKENTTMLKALAKQYDVAMIALAQINRNAVVGATQEPTINDFKGSGGIEEDADVAIILHRDRNEDRKDGNFATSGKLIIAKNRHGRTGEVGVTFDGGFGRFIEIGGI